MYRFVPVAAAFIILIVFFRFVFVCTPIVRFFVRGFNAGFKWGELTYLRRIIATAEPENPALFYTSLPLLNRCIGIVMRKLEADGTVKDSEAQLFLSRLYACRTKAELYYESKNALKNSRFIAQGQKLKLPGKDKRKFSSTVINNSDRLIISLPIEKGELTVSGAEWTGKKVTLCFFREGDALYLFDTLVVQDVLYNGRPALALEHGGVLTRSQKRKSIRRHCSINAMLFLGKRNRENRLKPEESEGLKCIIENLCEEGALIRIGGKAKDNMRIKIQFQINGKDIVMCGVSKAFEYNALQNESVIHFHCREISLEAKNIILAFVYKILMQ